MKLKSIYLSAGITVVCLAVSFFMSDMGSLNGFIVTGLFMFMVGLTAALAGLFLGEGTGKDGKRDVKFTIGGLVLGLFFMFIGGKDIVSSVVDFSNGVKEIHLENCEVTQVKSLRRMFSSYFVEGTDEDGNDVRYSIDEATYYDYEDEYKFSLDIIGWEKSGVVQEIID